MNLYDVIHQQNYPVGSLVIKDIHQRLSNTASELNLYAHDTDQSNFEPNNHQVFIDVLLKFTQHTEGYLNALRADKRKTLENEIETKIASLAEDYALPVKQVYNDRGKTVIDLW